MSKSFDQYLDDRQYAQDLLEKAGAIKVCRSHDYLIEKGPIEDAFRYFDGIVEATPRGVFSAERYESIVEIMSDLYDQTEDFCPRCRQIGIEVPDGS